MTREESTRPDTFRESGTSPSEESERGRPPGRTSSRWHVGDVLLNRYEVREVLGGPGQSGMGVVLVVVDRKEREVYAAKTLQEWRLKRRRAVRAFEREARLWMELGKHPNIVQAHFIEMVEERPFLFLEYVEGGDLSRRLEAGPLGVRRSLGYAIHFARGMVHARMNIPGFVHRDIKPGNCLITADEVAKVTDFGLAVVTQEDEEDDENGENGESGESGERATETSGLNKVAGTLAYMSPESFQRPPGIDARSDVYSFGVMLYRMLTGRYPLEADSYMGWMSKHVAIIPPTPHSRSAGIPDALADLVMRCLEKSADKRPGGFTLLQQELESILLDEFEEEIEKPTRTRIEAEDLRRRGVSLLRLGDDDEALETLEMALVLDPDNAAALSDRAEAHAGAGRQEEAFNDLSRALEIDPKRIDTMLIKCRLLERQARLDEALECCEAALSQDGRSIEAWLSRGRILERTHDFVHALHCFDRVSRMAPDDARGWLGKGRALVSLGSVDEGLRLLDRALEIDRELGEAWCARAAGLARQGHVNRALRSVDRALARKQDDAAGWKTRGEILLAAGRAEEAAKALDRALSLSPEDAGLWNAMGIACLALGRYTDAVADFEGALARAPDEVIYEANRARALYRLGHLEESRKGFEDVLGKDPDVLVYLKSFEEFEKLGL
ncbi:MAG: tetratricopeptide repeat protein [Deltaproteobacteria bacterium]|nr:tetratricopeptide repeat protein [Deltaproteobacteria bacterium]